MPKPSRNLEHTPANAGTDAQEQADAYESLFANRELELDDGTILSIPPHPELGMLSDEAMEAYEEIMFEIESYDREDSIYIPEARLKDSDGNETGVVIPASEQQGTLKRPLRKDGVLVKPPHSVRVVQAVLGDLEYKRLREGGKSAADVWRVWGVQGLEVKERQGRLQADAGAVDLAPIPAADRQ